MTTFKAPPQSFDSDDFEYPPDNDASKPVPPIDVVPPNQSSAFSSDSSFGATLAPAPVVASDSLLEATDIGTDEYQNLVATQPLSQSQHWNYDAHTDEDLVAVLLPSTGSCKRFDLPKGTGSTWKIGRAPTNDLVLPGGKLSNFHCTLTWNGLSGSRSEVELADNSSNGTWVNNVYLRRGETAILRGGAVISLGGRPDEPNEWRFIYRDVEGQSTRHAEQIWSKYDVGHELGSGAFARVHRCVERGTSTPYAVKIINRSRLGQAKSNEHAIVREIRVLQQLAEFRHKNIVSLREYFEEDDSIYLILELVRGGDLLTYIGHQGAMSEQAVKRMVAQICHAVAYVHSQGIAHRDLKPENVMLTADDPPNCKVADFGLAKLVDDGTFLRTCCGTPAYIAPEVMLRPNVEQSYDNRVDSWSLGVIIYCMLTNHAPFRETYHADMKPTEQRRYFGSRQVDWSVLEQYNVSDDCHDFLRCLLEEDPRNRKEVRTMLDHRWISALVPSDSQFQGLPSRCSTPPTLADSGLGACSQSLGNLSISEITAIPGLSINAQADVNMESFASQASVTSKIPGAYPKTRNGKARLAAVEEAPDAERSWELVARPRGAVRRMDDPGSSTHTMMPQIPAKRKEDLIAGSSPLTSLSDSESDSPSPPPPPAPKRGVRRAPTPHVRKLAAARSAGRRARASSSGVANTDTTGKSTRRAKVPRIS